MADDSGGSTSGDGLLVALVGIGLAVVLVVRLITASLGGILATVMLLGLGLGTNLAIRALANDVDWSTKPRSRIWIYIVLMALVFPVWLAIVIAMVNFLASDYDRDFVLLMICFIAAYSLGCIKTRIKIPFLNRTIVFERDTGDFLMAAEIERVSVDYQLWRNRCEIEAQLYNRHAFLIQVRDVWRFIVAWAVSLFRGKEIEHG